ncbi:MAG: hypothetical protein KAT58_11055 [candidate division Zixibacteria bacterium]|nr:hypothetical protein [candidate division Zixibacteria bacterium]
MNPTLSYLLGRRMWLVSGINVWGTIPDFDAAMVLTETEGAAKRIVFGSFALGGATQQIKYANLVDARGNQLPEMLTNPKVLVLAKNDINVIVSGAETAGSFALAKTDYSDRNGVCDLIIMEMG